MISKLVFLVILMVLSSCMRVVDKEECYHIIYVENYVFDKYGTPVILDDNQYYLGKTCTKGDSIFFYGITGNEFSAKYIDGLKKFTTIVNNKRKTYEIEVLNQKTFNTFAKKEYNSLPYQLISPEIGEKYYKNDWSKARGSELKEAIIK